MLGGMKGVGRTGTDKAGAGGGVSVYMSSNSETSRYQPRQIQVPKR